MSTTKELAIRILGVAANTVGGNGSSSIYGCFAMVDAQAVVAKNEGHYVEGVGVALEHSKMYSEAYRLAMRTYRDDAAALFGDELQGHGNDAKPWFWDKGWGSVCHIPGLLDAATACRKAAMQSAIRTLKGQA